MTREVRLARETRVAECQGLLAIEPLLVHERDDLLAAARRAVQHPETRVLGVVDDAGRLVGILPIVRLMEDVVARVTPESLMVGLRDVGGVARFSHTVGARSVADAMLPQASISPNATVGEAFRIMHERRLSGLYVTDPDDRPTGYLDLLELAVRYLDALQPTDDQGPSATDERR